MAFGQRVLKRRKELGLKQEALATQVGITASYVSQIEGGAKHPSYALMRKIAVMLGVSVDFLLGGDVERAEDDASKVALACMRLLTSQQKESVIASIYSIVGIRPWKKFPFFDNPRAYAEFLVDEHQLTPPVRPDDLARRLEVTVLSTVGDAEADGRLYKGGAQPLVTISGDIQNAERQRFTLAMMLGHLVIPWHIRAEFVRPRNAKSLDTEDELAIEAREFAGELLLPTKWLRNDLKQSAGGISYLEDLAYNKYGASLLAVAHKLTDFHGKTKAFLTSENGVVTRSYCSGLPFRAVSDLIEGSVAADLLANPPKQKEIRRAVVEARIWLPEAPKGMTIVEESMVDPGHGVIVTLLDLTN